MRCLVFSIISLSLLVALTCLALSNASLLPMSNADAENYLNEFFTVFDENMTQQFGPNSTIYAEYTNYEVYVTVSTVHGVGIEFFPSNKTQFHFKTVDVPIETAVFPSLGFSVTLPPMNASIFTWTGAPNGTMFVIDNATDIVMQGLVIVTNDGHFLELGEKGEIYLFDITVDGRYYHALILRGGNSPDYWSQNMAQKDASIFFGSKSYLTDRQAEATKESMAYPIFQTMLSQILWKDRNALETNYTLPEHDRDIETAKELAFDTYHLPSAYVDQFYYWLDNITPRQVVLPKQAWYEQAPQSWILGGIISTVSYELVRFPLMKWYRKRKPSVPPHSVN